jgi:hypothetical protein
MRYELSKFEWVAIKPTLRNKPRGISAYKCVAYRSRAQLQQSDSGFFACMDISYMAYPRSASGQ